MFRTCLVAVRGTLVALLVSSVPIQTLTASERTENRLEVATISPGEYAWAPELGENGAVEIVVSLPLQMAYVFRGGSLIGISSVSTGKPGHETPVGSFAILQKRKDHKSNLYDDAPMPYMQRLTWDGIALHGGAIPGHPASHGCVRLPIAFAKKVYALTQLGGRVHITDAAPSTATAALKMAKSSVGGMDRGAP